MGPLLLFFGAAWIANSVRMMWMGRGKAAVDDFVATTAALPDLPSPKVVHLSVANPLIKASLEVSLNGQPIGSVSTNQPLTFQVIKAQNVVNLPGGRESVCAFEVTDLAGEGRLQVVMGVTAAKIAIVEGRGLRAAKR